MHLNCISSCTLVVGAILPQVMVRAKEVFDARHKAQKLLTNASYLVNMIKNTGEGHRPSFRSVSAY